MRVKPLLMLVIGYLTTGGSMALAAEFNAELVEKGRYLVRISGCNDCHTPGYMVKSGDIPVEQWLKGDAVGWHGPWGTTYASNLRKTVQGLSADEWINYARNLKARPPMPWFALNSMTQDDLQAIYHFIRSLNDIGEEVPSYLPPGEHPKTPYVNMMVVEPGS